MAHSKPPAEPFEIADLAREVLGLVDGPFYYAGDSVGGAVGLQLLLDAPERVTGAALISTGAKIGEAEDWRSGPRTVRASGTAAMLEGSAQRWFAPGFLEREPGGRVGSAARPAWDGPGRVRTWPVTPWRPSTCGTGSARSRSRCSRSPGGTTGRPRRRRVAEIAAGVRHGRLVVLHDVAHLAPAEDPASVAALIIEEFA